MAELAVLVSRFEEAEQSGMDARAEGVRARKYYDGKQWTEAEKAALAKKKQAAITINRIRRKIDWLLGLEMQTRTDPKAFPRTPKHQQGAQAATDAIRFVCDQQDWDGERSGVWGDMLIEGWGGVEVIHDFRPPMTQPRVVINRYAADRLFWDPHSREADFSDARYKGAVIWSDAEALKEEYPDAADVIDASLSADFGGSGEFEDKPSWQIWSDPKRKRVRMVLMHYIERGVWKWAQFVRAGIVAEGESEYVDEDGDSLCPLIMASAYVGEGGDRHGVIRDMFDPQDEVNKRRSKLLHTLNTRQTAGIKGAVGSVRAMKAELANPDGHVEVDAEAVEAAGQLGMKAFEILPNQDQTAGQFNLLQEAKAELDLMGANSGLAGKDEAGGASGRAILARQQGGLIEIAPLTDRLSHFTREVYRQIWLRIRQFWTEETWVRVTDDERNVRFVGLNQPVTLADRLGQIPPEQAQAFVAQNGLFPGDPRLQQVVAIDNNVEEMDVDILIEEAPDAVTLEGETFEQLVNIATSMPGAVPPDVLIELAPGLRREVKDKLLERQQQQQAQAAQQGQAQAQMAQQGQQIEAQAKQASTAKDAAAAQKLTVEAVAKSIEAQRLAVYGV
ncbi:hypothetical protein BVG79_01081 [Ketogulonicigenium robustum]|uniref:Portal protein n=1 Tax=Ketogulonicigenium robustum TaxID=92947 RepID=A0A1W6NZI3_9RHOB|nr:hypothetical protein [Ketogulonicigenium robustum]ARO14427.1 hypothetical protein BVG79_01081 [Ketogulonicigenium robustum]